MTSKANIMIGTPAYNHQIHTDYLHSILAFSRAGINFSLMTIGNESLITRARNTIITKFNEHKDFTHLLFIDADIYLAAEDVLKLVEHDKDVVGAPVPLKGFDVDGNKRYNVGKKIGLEGSVATTEHLGTAVIMFSRKAVDALIEDAEKRGSVYKSNIGQASDAELTQHFDVFQVGVKDGQYLSEDYWVCHRLRELGFDIHVDLSIKVRHHGMYQF